MPARARLAAAIEQLLLLDGDDARLKAAALELRALLDELTAFDGEHPDNRGDSVLPSGIALAALDAAACVTDWPRTSTFMAGTVAAVHAARARFPDRRIEVVYAGCGPFALLVLPLVVRFTSAEVGFTLVDVHTRSLELARTLFAALDIEDYVIDRVHADATTYVHPRPHGFHVLVSETMRNALASEPQVAITLNLAGQLAPGGFLVPERITIGAYLDDLDERELFLTGDLSPAPERGRRAGITELGTIFELHAHTPPPVDGAFPNVTVCVPDGTPRYLVLSTRIETFRGIHLDDYASGLTYPSVLRTLGRVAAGSVLDIRYVPGQEPGFRYTLAHPHPDSVTA
ncbi:MAG TPA: hypothetical protein VK928_09415 [Longimicrobiales bacterium]|nr:hypothetical protein [Longimicrobiales bacterium]